MAIISEKNLAKSFVGLTILCMGVTFLNILRGINTKTSRPVALFVLDPNDKRLTILSQGNVNSQQSARQLPPACNASSQDLGKIFHLYSILLGDVL